MTAMMAVVFTTGVMAQTDSFSNSSKMENGKKNYIMGLRSSNQGLVESAMMQVAKIKMLHPDANIEEIKDVIDNLSIKGNAPSVRYKAYLASNVCDNPTWFAKKGYNSDEDVDEFFVSVAAQLQARVLGSRTN